MTNVRNLDAVNWESGPDRKLTHNTYRETGFRHVDWERQHEWFDGPCVRFHGTIIIGVKSEGAYLLNTNGWRTSTTKQRLNALLPGGIHVYQKNHDWFVSTRRGDIPFTDGMTVTAY